MDEQHDSPVASAITRRILMQRHDLLKQYGPELVGAAIDNVADYVGDVDEIGSSDVSAYVAQVERMLKENPPEAFREEKSPYGDYPQSPRAFGVGNFQRLLKANMGNIPSVTLEFPNPKDNIHLDKKGLDLISDYYDGLENDQMKNHFIYRVLPSADEVVTTLKRLGWHSAVQPELPGIPTQGELPLQEKKKFNSNSDVAAGDVKVARELQKLRAQYPAARSDVEAVAKSEIDSNERSQQQLSAIKGANTEQDRLLQQLVALDRKQGKEIGSLDNENDRLEQQLANVEQTNAKLAQTIGQMSGQGQSDGTDTTDRSQSRAINLIPNAPADAEPQAQPAAKAEPAEPVQQFKSKSNAMSQMARSLSQPRQVQGINNNPAPASMRGGNVVDLFPDNDAETQPPVQSLKRAAEAINEGQRLQRGDPVVVIAPNEFEGKTGEIYDFSPSGSFVIVDLYNHGKHSMHLSDVAYNDYADQEEENDWYDEGVAEGKKKKKKKSSKAMGGYFFPGYAYYGGGESGDGGGDGGGESINHRVAETALNSKDPQGDYAAKRKALQDLSMNKDVDQAAVLQRRLDLDREAKAKGVTEVAPPGAKAERMVKHIKKSLSKDGRLSDKDKAIAYATAWKARNAGKVEEARPEDLPGIDYDRPGDIPRKRPSSDHNPYPYSPEEDDDYFREIFRKKREAAAKAKSNSLKEFAPAGGSGSGNYFQALASAWYNGTFNTGSLQKGIKSKEDVERLLNRGIVCPDGVTRKLHIDYNSDFDGVEIYSDDYYEHGDLDGNDGRTGQPWGPYDFMAFSDDQLDEAANPAQQAAIAINMKKHHKKPKGMAEAQTDYQKRRQRERDVDAGRPVKPVPKNPQTDYARKRAKDRKDMEMGEGLGDHERREFKRKELQHELGHERNNIAIAINGKVWKVVPGKGYADSAEERAYLNGMRRWAEKKSATSGKKWTVSLTGANPTVNELSNEKLSQYKQAAALDAGAADKAGNFERGDKRFAGIIKATKKQFANDVKEHKDQGVAEGLMKEPTTRKEYLDQRDKLFRMMAVDSNPANKQIIKQALKDLEARYGKLKDPVREESSTASEAVERAILNRIMVAHTDLLMKFGPDKVMQAAEEVAYNVGDVDEIGTSDVSAYVNQVRQILGA